MRRSLLDTDTLSAIMRRRQVSVLDRARGYLSQFGTFTFSLITRYEILRGLKAKQADKQLKAFNLECRASEILPISDDVVVQAANLYASLRSQGKLISDADLLIASTAMIHGLVLVTNNTDHFSRIPGLELDSWHQSPP